MRKIVFLNNKGGVGKTASTATIAHLLASVHKKRTLIIDLDPQGNTSNLYSDVNVFEFVEALLRHERASVKIKSVEDLLIDQEMDIHECIQHTKYEGLDIIPSLLTLAEAEEKLKADIRTPQQFRLARHLKKVEEEYDYCLIDCSPSISIVNINGLAAADEVYFPLQTDAWSVAGMSIALDLCENVSQYNPSLKPVGCFFTQVDERKALGRQAYALVEEYLPDLLIPIKIGISESVKWMSYQQMPLGEVEKNRKKPTKALKAYMDLTEFIISSNKEEFKKNYIARQEREALQKIQEKIQRKEGK